MDVALPAVGERHLSAQDLVELVGDDVLGSLFLLGPKGVQELRDALFRLPRLPRILVLEIRRLHRFESHGLGAGIGHAVVRRPLEGHVLEHVGQARDAGNLLRSADVDDRRKREDRSDRPFHQQKGPAVLDPVHGGP